MHIGVLKTLVLVLLAIGVLSCASTHMKRYLSKDIREVVIDKGPPFYAFDLSDGRRAFQWKWGGGTFVSPTQTSTTGTVSSIGNTVWATSDTISSGGHTVTSEGCILTFIASWDEKMKGWIVTETRYPRRLVC